MYARPTLVKLWWSIFLSFFFLISSNRSRSAICTSAKEWNWFFTRFLWNALILIWDKSSLCMKPEQIWMTPNLWFSMLCLFRSCSKSRRQYFCRFFSSALEKVQRSLKCNVAVAPGNQEHKTAVAGVQQQKHRGHSSDSGKRRSCITEQAPESLSKHHLQKKPQDRQCQDHEQSLLLSVVSQHNETQHKVCTAGSADSLKPGNYL